MKKTFLLLLLALFFTGCDSNKVFQRYEDMAKSQWARDRIVSFEVNIEDASPKYNVELAIRHTTYYMWANLKVNLTTIYPSGEERTKDYEFFLKETNGSFKGEGAGDLWDITFPLLSDVQFPEKGKYIFKINNIMPIQETEDIMQVGLIVKKSDN